MVYGVLWLTISENSWAGLCGFGILLKNPSQTRPIPIVVNQLAPVQSTRHSCWVPEGSGQAVPTTRMLSYCKQVFLVSTVNHYCSTLVDIDFIYSIIIFIMVCRSEERRVGKR